MRRRKFITLLGGTILGGAGAGWPLVARAQQPQMPVIGFLGLGSPNPSSGFVAAFRAGLAEAGYVAGQNVAIESRWADNRAALLPQLAADLVDRKVDVIVTTGSPYAALAAKNASSTTPVVFVIGDDPVQYGLVTSLSRPGGTVTGMTLLSGELAAKRLNLLLEMMPGATTIAYLSGPSVAPIFEQRKREMLAAGRALGRKIVLTEVNFINFDAAFMSLVEQRADALIVGSFTMFHSPRNRDKILELVARHNIAAMYPSREFPDHGGLMSYDADSLGVAYRLGSHYVGQILKGANPAELPVQGPGKFELVISLKAMKALGLVIPRTLFAAAILVD
jgi:putative tryptophan/tyrosine transport system substrate-binding protein